MVEDERQKEDKFDFDASGEALGYISLEQARVQAIEHARDNTDFYGARYRNKQLVWEVVSAEEGEDFYEVRLSYRPVGRFGGTPGVEQFTIDKTGGIRIRQILDEPVSQRLSGRRVALVALGLLVVAAVVFFVTASVGDDATAPLTGAVATATAAPLAGAVSTATAAPLTRAAVTVTAAPATAPSRPIGSPAPVTSPTSGSQQMVSLGGALLTGQQVQCMTEAIGDGALREISSGDRQPTEDELTSVESCFPGGLPPALQQPLVTSPLPAAPTPTPIPAPVVIPAPTGSGGGMTRGGTISGTVRDAVTACPSPA